MLSRSKKQNQATNTTTTTMTPPTLNPAIGPSLEINMNTSSRCMTRIVGVSITHLVCVRGVETVIVVRV